MAESSQSSAQNANKRNHVNVDGLITNAIESISRLREMRPAMSNVQQAQPWPTMASEVVRLFPTFQQTALNINRDVNNGRNQDIRRGGGANKRRHTKVKALTSNKEKKRKLVHKDIVFLFDPSVDKVPTHNTRLRLENKGRIIHDFAFERDWEEWRVRSAIEEEMPMLANGEYEFLKVLIKCFNNL